MSEFARQPSLKAPKIKIRMPSFSMQNQPRVVPEKQTRTGKKDQAKLTTNGGNSRRKKVSPCRCLFCQEPLRLKKETTDCAHKQIDKRLKKQF